MILDDAFVALKRQGLYLVCAKGIEPFPEPCRDGNFVGGLIGPVVNGGGDLGQFLPDLFLGSAVDTPLDLFSGSGVPAHGEAGFPSSVGPLPDVPAAFGVLGVFSWH